MSAIPTLAAAPAPSLWLAAPFVLLLLSIAIGSAAFHRLWERIYPYVALGFGLIPCAWYLFAAHDLAPLLSVGEEYFSFITLIGSFFVIAGGIHLRVRGRATPAANCLFLLLAALASNIITATGASMLLIRPWLQLNRRRASGHHIAFFIFLVSNVGGSLTPIGNPPLFLGFLQGIPFWWTLSRCWRPCLLASAGLLVIFYFVDRRSFRLAAATEEDADAGEDWHFDGLINLALLAVALVSVFLPFGIREGVLIAVALVSWFATPRRVHVANRFSFSPIIEVAILFAGLFATMSPALQWLEANAGALGLSTPFQFYWLTGVLSGILDNAPTYLAFLAAALGLTGHRLSEEGTMPGFLQAHEPIALAISVASVFFGAATYLGNGPNLMVRSVARQLGVRTPGFVRYVTHFVAPYLLPVLFLVGMLFFSRWRVF